MHVWLQGPSGAGKSTVGRLLAERRGTAFVDLDERIERAAGRRVAEIFRIDGEPAFRRLEQSAIEALRCDGGSDAVIAVGGGAVEDPSARQAMADCGMRVFLDVSADVALARLRADASNPRPLLSDDVEGRWRELHGRRLESYLDADLRVCGDDLPADVVAAIERGLDALLADAWTIESTPGGHTTVVRGITTVHALRRRLRASVEPALSAVVIDANVAAHYGDLVLRTFDGYAVPIVVDAAEAIKTLPTAESIVAELSSRGVPRNGTIVAVGGGVVCDLAGFVAAIYMRGVRALYVPTTLLAMVDAAIGGKTAVNAGGIRNLVGVIRQPSEVLVAPWFLRTLEPRELRSGLVESLKMGALHSRFLFDAAVAATPAVLRGEVAVTIDAVIRASVELKLHVVESDELDHSVRTSLNFGHTFAHALEAVEPRVYTHGEAVALGMIAASLLSAEFGLIGAARLRQITDAAAVLAQADDVDHDYDALLAAMRSDKKAVGSAIRFVLPTNDGFALRSVDDASLIVAAMSRAFDLVRSAENRAGQT